jgi:hypothetical protein
MIRFAARHQAPLWKRGARRAPLGAQKAQHRAVFRLLGGIGPNLLIRERIKRQVFILCIIGCLSLDDNFSDCSMMIILVICPPL